jgi:hypothetical protein
MRPFSQNAGWPMQPSVRSTKFNEAIRLAPLHGETRRVREYEPSRTGVWQRGVVPSLMIAAFLLMTAEVVVGLDEYKPLPKCFAISRAGALCH